jgi:hypothetical protein
VEQQDAVVLAPAEAVGHLPQVEQQVPGQKLGDGVPVLEPILLISIRRHFNFAKGSNGKFEFRDFTYNSFEVSLNLT